jgi:hypothetical protein
VRLHLDEQGSWLIGPAELAHRLGVSEWTLRRQASLGLVDSRLDRGYGRDEGRSRVTVTIDKFGWQGIFGPAGELLSEFRWEPRPSAMAINRRMANQGVEADWSGGKKSGGNLKSA